MNGGMAMRSRLLAAACLMPLALVACGRGTPPPDNVLPVPPPSPPPEPVPPPPTPAPAPPGNQVTPVVQNGSCGGMHRLPVPCTGPPSLRTCYIDAPNPPCPTPPVVAPPHAANMAN